MPIDDIRGPLELPARDSTGLIQVNPHRGLLEKNGFMPMLRIR